MSRFISRTYSYGRAIHIGGLTLLSEGFSLRIRRHNVEYWAPWAYKPLSIREGIRGHHGRWGAIDVITRGSR